MLRAALLLLALLVGPTAQITPGTDPAPATDPVALDVSVDEKVQTKDVPVVSAEADIAGQKTLSLALSSSEWSSKPGITVTAVMEQWDGKTLDKDGNPAWTLLMGFTATSGPVTDCPGGPPCSDLPSMSFSHPKLVEGRKVRVRITPSDDLSVGAVAASSDKDLGGK